MYLSPEKKKKLLLLGVLTLAAAGAFWFLFLEPAQVQLAEKVRRKNDLTQSLYAEKKVIQRAEMDKAGLLKSSTDLRAIEDQMVTGDPFLWVIKSLHAFEVPNKMEIVKADMPVPADSNLPKNIPYKAFAFAFTGTANYHDLGAFLARFENTYPYVCVQRLDVEPAGVPAFYDEKLSFLLEIRVLVKPVNVPPSKFVPRS